MSKVPESSARNESPSNDGVLAKTAGEQPADSIKAGSLPPELADAEQSLIDQEVADAMSELPSFGGTEDLGATAGPGDSIGPGESVEPGSELTGTVVGLSGDDVFLEFGAKCQGVLARSQFGKKEQVEVGRRVDVVVEQYDNDSGLLIVNRLGTIQRATWNNLCVGMLVEGRVTGLIKGGLELDVQGIRAFMPGSQASNSPMKDISVLLNEKIRCEVMEVDRRGKNLLVSRRKLIERDEAEARERLKAELEVGQLRRGTVRNITEFGAFVDLGGLEGLVHISDLRWGSVEKVSDVLSTGQEVEVKVLKIDLERNRISLGLKHAQPDPWVNAPEQYPVGTALKVRIVRIADFGAFAELEQGVEGLIPISEMAWNRVQRTSDVVSVGDVIDAVVIRIEPKKRRLALSMKQAQPDPWAGVLESFSAQSLAKGRVTRVADFGAFVELVPGVEGLIHISELSDRRVKACGDVVQVGQELEARVLGVDVENRRISLSLKQVDVPAASNEKAASEPPKQPKKRKKPLRGGLSSHFNW